MEIVRTNRRARRPSLARKAYQSIKDDILAGIFKPGELIVESQMASRYRLGKTPVREALQALKLEGLVDAIPRAGYLVVGITPSDVRELFQLRLILETAAAELAAGCASEHDLELIREAADFEYTHGDQGSYEYFIQLNKRFHHLVAQASGNRRLAQLVLRLMEKLEMLFNLELDLRDSANEMLDEHRALAAELCERNPESARLVMAEQIQKSRDRVIEAIVRPQSDPTVGV